MKHFLITLALFVLCACSRPQTILGALAVNASLCHLPPVLVVINADGTHRTYARKDVSNALLDEIHTLPDSHIATVMVPCGDSPDTKLMSKHHDQCGDEDWSDDNARLWFQTHCHQISWRR